MFWLVCYNALYLVLQRLWFLLDQYHTPPLVGDDQMINFEDFQKVAAEAGAKCQYVIHALVLYLFF